MRKVAMGVLGAFLMAGVLPAVAQDDGARPAPKLIQIYREMVKPGRGAAHAKLEAGWPKAYKASKNSAHYLAMTSITGPNEAWFVSGYDSYEAMEKQTKAEESDTALSAELSRLQAADGEFLESTRSITARFREELSLRPPLNMGSYRYLSVTTIRVRPGMGSKFIELRKIIKAAHEKAGMKDYYSVFEVQSGMSGPAFLIFVPMKSLKEVDEAGPLHTSAAYREALGGDDGEKKMTELASAAVMSNEGAIFGFSPKMSVPPPEYLSGNADYWNPKPTMAATPKAKTTAAVKKP
jgi:hypothetical protein